MAINWNNPESKITPNFTVHEATFLPSWKIHHIPNEDEKLNILETAKAMEKIRDFLKTPINIHCWIRPNSVNCPTSQYHGKDYNAHVKGAKQSAHIAGKAVDWDNNSNCDFVRVQLLSKLPIYNICMEDLPGSQWVHIDVLPPRGGKTRFFKP